MARKQRPSHLDDPPAVSSSTEEEEEEEEETFSDDDDDEDEQEEEGGGEQEEVEEEEEGEQSSSEEEEEEEEAEAAKIESLPSTPPVKPHPSSSGPMEPESTPVKATQARSTRSSTIKNKKRPNSETETTLSKSKRVKKKDPDPEPKSQGGGGEEKKLFQRLWSDDNEIELLKGMLDYRAIHDSDPAADAAAFYKFVKESLHVEVTKAQLVDKMRRIRKKYRNNARRAKKGKEPTFSKPHDRKTYELSNKIWGPADGVSVSGRCLNGMLSFNKDVMVLDETLIKRGLELIGEQKRLELEERWKRVELAELQMYVTRAELIRDQASLILEAYKGH